MDDFIPVCKPFLWGEEIRYVNEALTEGWISSAGRFLEEFEQRYAAFSGNRYGVATSSGTTALHLALSSLGVTAGDEVIVPDFSMMAPIFAVQYCGATPVPVDAEQTWNIDPALIEERITERTRGVIVVHTYGHPARVDEISEICRRRGLFLVEDAAEAHGARLGGRKVGTFGDIAIYSFYANKIVTTGEGGMLMTDNAELYQEAAARRNMCFGSTPETRFCHEAVGFNYRMTNLQAAVGLGQLEHVEEAIRSKIDIARRYNAALSEIEGLSLPPEEDGAKNVYWVYGLLVEDGFGVHRRALQEHLEAEKIQTRRFFTPVHQQPSVPGSHESNDFPVSTRLSDRGFYLPSFIGMGDATIDRVVETLRKIQQRYRR